MSSTDQATLDDEPAPRARNHKARVREASIERILDAAEQLFAEFGYHGVTLKDVAARVGVSSTLIHYHFNGKESIYEAVWARKAPISARNRLGRGADDEIFQPRRPRADRPAQKGDAGLRRGNDLLGLSLPVGCDDAQYGAHRPTGRIVARALLV